VRLALAAVLLAGGCDKLLGLDSVVQPPPPDAPPPDAPPCVNGPLADSFDTEPPCNGLGFVDNDSSTMVTIAGGRLVIQPGADTVTTRGGCISGGVTMPFTSQYGAIMQVTSTHGPSEYMDWTLDWVGTTDSSTISYDPSGITYAHGTPTGGNVLGHIPFDSAKTSWVRMRPSDDGTAVVAEFSGDGYAWTIFAWDLASPPSAVGVLFYGGTFAAESQPATIYFDGFDTCP
jgi:hypothetical protein